ncbi:MAG: uroporphyrinogen decarboxylase family protein [Armatimonadota bacterium]
MAITHLQRLETAWAFQEADRVPIELDLSPRYRQHPLAARLVELVDEHVDSFRWTSGLAYGFFGLPAESTEEVIEEQPGAFRRIRHTLKTAIGDFSAITYHPVGSSDYHWEKRYIATVDELRKIAEADRPPARWDADAWRAQVTEIGESGLPFQMLYHPLGALVRSATMEEMYAWFYDERETVHRFLESMNAWLADGLTRMLADGVGRTFVSYALEMLIPPWFGETLFDEFVFPYDSQVNAAIHRGGGRHRAHCHGCCFDFLERFVTMGIDATEPLEHLPAGNTDLAEAKRRVGDRMMLSGNVRSEMFYRMTPDEVCAEVKAALTAAPGGGFTLATSGAGTDDNDPDEYMPRTIENCVAYIEAGLEYGQYPIDIARLRP